MAKTLEIYGVEYLLRAASDTPATGIFSNDKIYEGLIPELVESTVSIVLLWPLIA